MISSRFINTMPSRIYITYWWKNEYFIYKDKNCTVAHGLRLKTILLYWDTSIYSNKSVSIINAPQYLGITIFRLSIIFTFLFRSKPLV
jgi:hypothetical protein